MTVTEEGEELEDENSVKDGSYIDQGDNNDSKLVSEVNETITSKVDMTPRTDNPSKGIKVPF